MGNEQKKEDGLLNRGLILAGLFLILPVCAVSQNSHTVNVELGGPGLLHSLNYEYGFHSDFALRVGYGTPILFNVFYDYQNFIVTGHYKLGEGRGKLDLGGGMAVFTLKRFLFWELEDRITVVNPVLNIGYRLEPIKGSGVQFKIAFTPIFTLFEESDQVMVPWGGLSLGYTF